MNSLLTCGYDIRHRYDGAEFPVQTGQSRSVNQVGGEHLTANPLTLKGGTSVADQFDVESQVAGHTDRG